MSNDRAHEISERLYNNTVDALTNTNRAEGYRVLLSHTYVEAGENRYIIWAHLKTKKAFRLLWNVTGGTIELQYGKYKGEEKPIDIYFETEYEIFLSYIDFGYIDESNIVNDFVEAFTSMNNKRWKPKRKYEVQLRDSRSYERFLWSIGLAVISLAISFISGLINKPPEYDISVFRTFMEQRQDSLSKLKTTDTSKTFDLSGQPEER